MDFFSLATPQIPQAPVVNYFCACFSDGMPEDLRVDGRSWVQGQGCLTDLLLLLHRGGWGVQASCWFLHLPEPRSGLYMPTAALGTQRGPSRQKSVNMSCQKQIAVFPEGLN
jgi:hypothetical protein